jgi:hypothetical protein
MMTFRLSGGLLPTEILLMSMAPSFLYVSDTALAGVAQESAGKALAVGVLHCNSGAVLIPVNLRPIG